MKTLISAVILATAWLLATFTLTLAWPDQPPDKAFISGPGIEGQVQITDAESLNALKLGAIEDFAHSIYPAPTVGEGYKIIRYFYNGTFDFGRLTYYPVANDTRGYVYFEDGPAIRGNSTPYNLGWFYATPAGDAAMKKLLARLQVTTTNENLKTDAGANPVPVTNNSQASAPTTTPAVETSDDAFANVRLAAEIIIVLGAASLAFFLLRRRQT